MSSPSPRTPPEVPAIPFGTTLLLLALALAPQLSAQQPTAPTDAPPSANFFSRLASTYRGDWHPDPNAPASSTPERRGLPSPISSPPFFNADWPYGGSPTIGEPDTNTYPLATAINGARSRIKLYGYIEPSVNVSTSSDSNAPAADDLYPDRLHLDQASLILERIPDSVQRDHLDWGFHLSGIVGTNYRYTTNLGYFSSQSLKHNNQYGFDPTLNWFDLYIPHVAQGMNLRIGRFTSIAGIEAQVPPFNYTYTHSLLYVIDPGTDTGITATVKLSDQWLIQGGLSAGHDVAPWTSDAKPSGTLCLDYTTHSVNDNLYVCANGINSARYAYDNIQQYDATWYHRFSKRVHTATEGWFMYQRGVPAVGGPIAPEPNTDAAVCHTGLIRCTAPEYAIENYVNLQISPHDDISVRSDFLNDKRGQRTGTQSRYYENTVSWTRWFGSTVQLRPELRFGRALDRGAYDNGTRQNQFTAASDLIFHF